MQGFQLCFFTSRAQRHDGLPLAEWLLREARAAGIGVTVIEASEGIGRHHHFHSAKFFELGDQPVEVLMAMSAEQVAPFFARLAEERLEIFYVKTPIEFGLSGA